MFDLIYKLLSTDADYLSVKIKSRTQDYTLAQFFLNYDNMGDCYDWFCEHETLYSDIYLESVNCYLVM